MRHRLWIDGTWQEGEGRVALRSPYDQSMVAEADQAAPVQMTRAIEAAAAAAEPLRRLSRAARGRLLALMVEALRARGSRLVESMVLEAGKPLVLAEAELGRALATFTAAAEEARRLSGELIPVDGEASTRAFAPALSLWVPRGPVLGITPFNFPLNLVAHKVAPALAVGAPILIKASPQAPGAAVLLAEAFAEAAPRVEAELQERVPFSALQVLCASNEVTSLAVRDRRMSTLSFTGSAKVGWLLQGQALGKRVLLELGGNAAVIVHRDADLRRAAERCAMGAFGYAGQSCISVQRIYVQESVRRVFAEELLGATARILVGDPRRKEVLCGPLIDEAAAQRVEAWVEEAQEAGARLLCGGQRRGTIMQPTLAEGVDEGLPLSCEEVFGPVAVLAAYSNFSDAVAAVNRSRYGLQAGVFTDSMRLMRQAAEELEVGAVLLNEAPTFRAEVMPYGGVKDSGLGREGVRYAMEEYCERRTVVMHRGS